MVLEMTYSLTVKELLKRPIIRDDQPHEYLNKMTDEEIERRYAEIDAILEADGVPKVYPDWNAAHLAKIIDSHVLYQCFKLGDNDPKRIVEKGIDVDHGDVDHIDGIDEYPTPKKNDEYEDDAYDY